MGIDIRAILGLSPDEPIITRGVQDTDIDQDGGYSRDYYALPPMDTDTYISIPAISAAIKDITQTILKLPMDIYRDEEVTDVPVDPAFKNLLGTMLFHLLTEGDGFAAHNDPELKILDNSSVSEISWEPGFQGLRKQYIIGDDRILLPQEFVVHMMLESYTGLRGISPISQFNSISRMILDAISSGDEALVRGYTMILLHMREDVDLTPAQRTALRNSFDKALGSKHRAVTLPSTVASATPIQLEQSGVLSILEFAPIIAGQIYRIPVSRVAYPKDSTYNNRIQDSVRYATDTIEPIVAEIVRAYNRVYLPDTDYTLKIDITRVYEERFADKVDTWIKLVDAGFQDEDQAWEALELEPPQFRRLTNQQAGIVEPSTPQDQSIVNSVEFA